MKIPKGSIINMGLIYQSEEHGQAVSDYGHDDATQSAESCIDGSLDASDDIANEKACFSSTKERSFDLRIANGTTSNGEVNAGNLCTSSQANHMSNRIDVWNASAKGSTPIMTIPPQVAPHEIVKSEGVLHDQWFKYESAVKRRKQYNGEAIRRSRLLEQTECEELQQKVEKVNNENHALRVELHRLAEECGKLTSKNNSIMGKLTRLYGSDATSDLQGKFFNS